jgi:photosystem II stability/assembly factor-like uncharacterized protein
MCESAASKLERARRSRHDRGRPRKRSALLFALRRAGLATLFCIVLLTRAALAVERLTTYLPAEPSKLAAQTLVLDVAAAGERLVAVGAFGHVLLSDDYGTSWRQADGVPTQVTLTAVTFVDTLRGWAVGHDAVIIHTEDGGLNWTLQYSDLAFGNPLLTVAFLDESRGLAMGALGRVLETRDGGQRWHERQLRRGDVVDLNLNKLLVSGGTLYVASEFGLVYRSQDGGASFAPVQSPSSAAFWNAVALPTGALLFMGADGTLWRASPSLQSWARLNVPKGLRFSGGAALADGRFVLVGAAAESSQDGAVAFGEATDDRLIVLRRRGGGHFTAAASGPRGAIVLAGEKGLSLIADRPGAVLP